MSNKLNEFRISYNNLNLFYDENFAKQAFEKGLGHSQAVLGVSNEVLQRYYQAAIKVLEKQDWKNAVDAFLFLTYLNPLIYNFWLGLGVAQQSMGEYEAALTTYLMVEKLNPEDPVCYANAFQCCAALGDKETAANCYHKAIECCGDSKEWTDLRKNLKDQWEKFK